MSILSRLEDDDYQLSLIGLFTVIILSFTLYILNVHYYVTYTQFPNHFSITKSKLSNNNDTLVDLFNFEYVMNNPSLCSPLPEWGQSTMVIMIYSNRSCFDQRHAIRNTWGSVKQFKGWLIHLIFLLGSDRKSDPEFDYLLRDEHKMYGDLIVGNFIDTYENLTYKHLMGYKWVNTFCPEAKFILKSDDYMYVDIFQVVEVLLIDLIASQKSFACQNMEGNTPVRHPDSRFFVSKELYPYDIYPPYCSGSAFIIRADDAAKIYSVSNKTTFFSIDNIFVTGILRLNYTILADQHSSLEILDLQSQYHVTKKNDIIAWCTKSSGLLLLNYTFIALEKRDFVSDTFCIWNKNKLIRFALNSIASGIN